MDAGKINTPFVVGKDHLLFEQFLIKKVGDNEHWFFGKYHHLITDGYGFTVWIQYLAKAYRCLVSDEEIELTYPSYLDEVLKADQYYHSNQYQLEGEYWKERIKEKPQKFFQKRTSKKNSGSHKSSTYILDASEQQAELISQLQLDTKISLQLMTIAALIIYFGKTSSETDFAFGVSLHKRGSKRHRSIVGMFYWNLYFSF